MSTAGYVSSSGYSPVLKPSKECQIDPEAVTGIRGAYLRMRFSDHVPEACHLRFVPAGMRTEIGTVDDRLAETACWTYIDARPDGQPGYHLICLGEKCLTPTRPDVATQPTAQLNYLTNLLEHEVGHLRHTERDFTKVQAAAQEENMSMGAINVGEDCRIEALITKERDYHFAWDTYRDPPGPECLDNPPNAMIAARHFAGDRMLVSAHLATAKLTEAHVDCVLSYYQQLVNAQDTIAVVGIMRRFCNDYRKIGAPEEDQPQDGENSGSPSSGSSSPGAPPESSSSGSSGSSGSPSGAAGSPPSKSAPDEKKSEQEEPAKEPAPTKGSGKKESKKKDSQKKEPAGQDSAKKESTEKSESEAPGAGSSTPGTTEDSAKPESGSGSSSSSASGSEEPSSAAGSTPAGSGSGTSAPSPSTPTESTTGTPGATSQPAAPKAADHSTSATEKGTAATTPSTAESSTKPDPKSVREEVKGESSNDMELSEMIASQAELLDAIMKRCFDPTAVAVADKKAPDGDPNSGIGLHTEVEYSAGGKVLRAEGWGSIDRRRVDRCVATLLQAMRGHDEIIATDRPTRRLDHRLVTLGSDRPYKQRVEAVQGTGPLKVVVIMDCSGSMSQQCLPHGASPISEGRHFVAVLNELAKRRRVEGILALSKVGYSTAWCQAIRLPMPDKDILRITADGDGEGLAMALERLAPAIRDADMTALYTDGNITDVPIDKAKLHKKGVHLYGLYVGPDSRSPNLRTHTDYPITADSLEVLTGRYAKTLLNHRARRRTSA